MHVRASPYRGGSRDMIGYLAPIVLMGSSPLQATRPLQDTDVLTVLGRIEPPLDPSLDDAPDRRQYQIPERDGEEVLNRLEGGRVVSLCVEEHLVDADEGQQRRVLDHPIELVAERRHDHPGGLRQYDTPHRQRSRHPHGKGRLHLPWIDGLDT